MAEKKIPRIRFEGFTEAWEQCKLNDITDVRDGTHDSPKYFAEGHPFITSKNVKNGYLNFNDVQYISDADFDAINCRSKVDVNDILMGMIGTIGNIALVRKTPDFAIKNVALIKDTGLVYPKYIYHFLESSSVENQLINSMDGGTQKFIALNKVRELDVKVPNKKEQLLIGDFLEEIDSSITLHQRKCEKLKMFKKSMLEKMFPKNGEKVPEVRFDGFTDDWEQCELEEYLYVSTRKNDDDFYSREDVLSVSGDLGIVNQIELKGRSYAGASVSNYGVVKHGDIVYTKSPLKSNPYGIIKTNKGPNGIVSTLYAIYEPKPQTTVGEFVQIYFEQDARVNSYLHPLVNKGAKNDMKVSDSNALKGKVIFPAYAEQKRISLFFSKLDKTITLHHRKLAV